MSDLKDLFEAFYGKLILRDFFAKIVPGALLLTCLMYPSIPPREFITSVSASVWLWIFFVGLAWSAGFGVQAFGEIYGFIRYYPKILEKMDWKQIRAKYPTLKNLDGKNVEGEFDREIGDTNFQEFLDDFDRAPKNPAQTQQRERFVVIKEACGNTYLALMIGLIKVELDNVILMMTSSSIKFTWSETFTHSPSMILVAALVYYLYKMHLIHVDRQFRHMMKILRNDQNRNVP